MRLFAFFQLILFVAILTAHNPYSFAKQSLQELTYGTAKEEDYCRVPTKKTDAKEKTEAASPETCPECMAKAKEKALKESSEKILVIAQSREQKINEALALKEINPGWLKNNGKQYTESSLKLLLSIKLDTLSEKKSAFAKIHNTYQKLCIYPENKSLFSDADCAFLKEKMELIKKIQPHVYKLNDEEFSEITPHIDESRKYLEEYLAKKLQSFAEKKVFDINNITKDDLEKMSDEELNSIFDKIFQLLPKHTFSNRKIPCGLSFTEYFLLVQYTGGLYSPLNSELRKKGTKYTYTEKILNSALSKFLDIKTTVKRGATLNAEALSGHQVGSIIIYDGFTSTSKKRAFDGNITFIIKSIHGKYIAPISNIGHEEEVLFKSKTKFKIISKEGNTVVMEEVD